MSATVADLRSRVLAYAERRLPALTRLKRSEPLPIRLDRRRIYVLPTAFGFAFALLMFVMLVGALNYANNPALLLTCIFGAAAGASLFVGFRVMSGLELTRVGADECHAGTPLTLHLGFTPGRRTRPSLCLRHDTADKAFALRGGGTTDVTLAITAEHRGWLRPGRIRLSTDYPLGLFHVWSWLNPDREFLVYPGIESPSPPLPAGDGREDERTLTGPGEEHAGLRDYRITDPPRLIAWKVSARHDALLVHDSERRGGDSLTLDYARLSGIGHEARIRRLTAWVLAAEAAQRSYLLKLPSESFGPGIGTTQRHACLRALALLPSHD